jgi:superfamily II DNA helicase RecQ
MAQKRPRTLEEFARITGVGQAKARDFSRIFLEEIARHGSAADVPWPVG